MNLSRIFIISFLLTVTPTAFAFFCPNGFNQINIGDTIATVQQQCGAPTTQKSHDATDNVPQEWTYYTKTSSSDATSLTLTVYFEKGIATNLTVNNVGVATTQICNGNSATMGATMEQIKKSCGPPMYVKLGTNPGGLADTQNKITEFTYTGTPTVVLTFENGLLKSRQ